MTMNNSTATWAFRFRLGHSYFERAGAIAVADNSMRDPRDPATSDDGLLLLDMTETVVFSANGYARIRCLCSNGLRTATSGDWAEGIAVCKHFGLRPQFDAKLQALVDFIASRDELGDALRNAVPQTGVPK
jgi:hypothetical protein